MATPPEQIALTVLELARAGRFAEVRDLLAPQLRDLVTPEALETAWKAELDKQGPVTSVGAPVIDPGAGGSVVVKLPVTCERGGFALIAPVSAEGQLIGLQLAPLSAAAPIAPWEPPHYADVAKFDEQEVTLGPEPLRGARHADRPARERPVARPGAPGRLGVTRPRRDDRAQQAAQGRRVGTGQPGRGRPALRQGHLCARRRAQGCARVHPERRVPAAGHGGGHAPPAARRRRPRPGLSSSATAWAARSRPGSRRPTRRWRG